MALVTWQISVGLAGVNAPKSLKDWGISFARLTRSSLDVDELTLRTDVADIYADPVFAYADRITLWRVSSGVSTIWFSGTVRRLPAVGSGSKEGNEYAVLGPWWELNNIVYQQYRNIGTLGSLTATYTTQLMLFQDSAGAKITNSAQAQDAIAYALAQGSGISGLSISSFFDVPLSEQRDLTCAEVLRRCASYTPDCVSYFIYSTTSPGLVIARRASLTPVAIDLANANYVTEFTIAKRSDLVPTGVVFYFIGSAVDPATSLQMATVATQSAGSTSGVGVLRATIDLMGHGTLAQELAPTNFASNYYSALSTPQWEGTIVLKEAECSGAILIGNVVNFTSGRTEWTTMNAVVQSVSEDFITGETTLEVAPTAGLSPQDFVNLIMFNRRSGPQTSFNTAITNGGDTVSNYAKNTGPSSGLGGNTVAVQVCDNGTARTLQLLTPCSGTSNPCP